MIGSAVSWRGSRFGVEALLAVLVAGLLGLGAACTPEIGIDPYPEAMEFDPTADPPRSPQPNGIVMNPQTGLVDMSLAGIQVAEDCRNPLLTDTPLAEAQCEFFQYLQTLEGFPSVSPASAPVSAPIDLATVTMPDNLLILDADTGQILTNARLSWSDFFHTLNIEMPGGWELGHTYVIGVRGYDNGVTAGGTRVVASAIYYLLRQEEPLTCGATTPAEVDLRCKYFRLLAQQLGDEHLAAEELFTLEALRQNFLTGGVIGFDVWDVLTAQANMDKGEVAIVWTFPIHTAPVAELNPTTGIVPTVVSTTRLSIDVRGGVDPATPTAFSLGNSNGSVILLDLTALAAGDLSGGMPDFTVSASGSSILIDTVAPMVDGNLYGVIFRNKQNCPAIGSVCGIKDMSGVPLVASPVTVFLRSRGALIDAQGRSNLSNLTDAQAAQLEAGRASLDELLSDPMFVPMTGLQNREDIVYLYAFEYPNPLP